MSQNPTSKARNLLRCIADGLVGYMTYQSRCGMSEAYTEYLLYDPIVRIAKDKKWIVKSEYSVAGFGKPGDNKRIDFFMESISHTGLLVGIEVKWIPAHKKALNLTNDRKKLTALKLMHKDKDLRTYIALSGVHTDSKLKQISNSIKHNKELIYQQVFKSQHTSYGTTIIETK